MKNVLVTGSSGAIGSAIVKELVLRGCNVIVHYLNNKAAADSLADFAKARGQSALAARADLSDPCQVKDMFGLIKEKFSQVHALVNNAGILHDRRLKDMPEDDWDDVLNINLKSAYLCCKYASLSMVAGSIINISSVVGLDGNFGQCNYAASKAGMVGLTKSLAKELAPDILVNAIAPGLVDSKMSCSMPAHIKESFIQKTLLKRLCRGEEIAKLVAYLVLENSYITGSVIRIDGGLRL